MQDKIEAPQPLLRAQKLANLMDTKIKIPFLGIRFGLDFIVGLIPVVGDLIMTGLAISIVGMAKSMGVPKEFRLVMLRNIAIDFLLGLIPLLGDVIDMFYRSNQKNVRIIEKWWVAQHHAKIKAHSQDVLDQWQKIPES
jgi:hypothetical protein